LFGLAATFFVVWIFREKVDRKSFLSIGFQMKNFVKDVSLGLMLGIAIMALGFGVLLVLGEIRIEAVQFDLDRLLLGLLLFVCVAIEEELLVRGYILNNFMDSWNKYLALAVSSLLFAMLHLANPNLTFLSFFNILLAGLLLGLSYIFTRNFWFPVALHFSWNFFQGTIFGFQVSGNETWSMVKQTRLADTLLNGGSFGFEGSLLAVIFQVVALALVFFFFRKRTPKVLPDDGEVLNPKNISPEGDL
jgi:membrane protease YdiL (CAAX protease family)